MSAALWNRLLGWSGRKSPSTTGDRRRFFTAGSEMKWHRIVIHLIYFCTSCWTGLCSDVIKGNLKLTAKKPLHSTMKWSILRYHLWTCSRSGEPCSMLGAAMTRFLTSVDFKQATILSSVGQPTFTATWTHGNEACLSRMMKILN